MDNIFVTTDWLAQHLSDPKVVILDGSWFLPAANRKPREEYLAGHIPGAVFFDIDGVADHSTDLPHMLLSPEEFGRQAGTFDDRIVAMQRTVAKPRPYRFVVKPHEAAGKK